MKRLVPLMLAALCAMSAVSAGQYCFEVKSTNDVSALVAAFPEWESGKSTNGVTITVCIGWAHVRDDGMSGWDYPLLRDLTFDADGRLAKVSPINVLSKQHNPNGPFRASVGTMTDDIRKMDEFKNKLMEAEKQAGAQRTTSAPARTLRIRDRPIRPAPSGKPCGDGR